jgi:hypothetical protein
VPALLASLLGLSSLHMGLFLLALTL